MDLKELGLKEGKWLVSDCGKTPSESNCQLVIMGPADQKEDLKAAGIQHMIHKHGHEESPELAEMAEKSLEEVEVS